MTDSTSNRKGEIPKVTQASTIEAESISDDIGTVTKSERKELEELSNRYEKRIDKYQKNLTDQIKLLRQDNLNLQAECKDLNSENKKLLIDNHRLQVYEDISWFQVGTNALSPFLLGIGSYMDSYWKTALMFLGIAFGIMGITLHFPWSKFKAYWWPKEKASPQ